MEQKMRRMMQQGADIGDAVDLIFTDRNDGVIPETDIRHQSWDTAVEAADTATRDHLTKRDARHKPPVTDEKPAGEGKTDTKME